MQQLRAGGRCVGYVLRRTITGGLLRLDDDELRPIVDKGLLGPARQASDVALRVVALHVLAHHDDEGVEHFGLVLSELGASAPYDVHHTIQGLGGSLDGLVVALVAVLELRHAGHKRKLMRACEGGGGEGSGGEGCGGEGDGGEGGGGESESGWRG